jgi:formamidopyrimidine-DNA glycosylase
MPELPEVEVLARYLDQALIKKRIGGIRILRSKVVRPTTPALLQQRLRGCVFEHVNRRGKYLIFTLRDEKSASPVCLLGHLGMTGRLYLQPVDQPLAKHTAVVMNLGLESLVFEDTRYFGRLTLDTSALGRLGPEPLSNEFQVKTFHEALARSRQSIKHKLLDQALVTGIGNIYASESLFHAGIHPGTTARDVSLEQARRLWRAIRGVLRRAIAAGSTVPLSWSGRRSMDRSFYFGREPGEPDYYDEGLQVYDRQGKPCRRCKALVQRITQGARSSYFCPQCQRPA